MTTVEKATKERVTVRGLSTRLANKLTIDHLDNLDVNELTVQLAQVNKYLDKLQALDPILLDQIDDQDDYTVAYEECETYEHKLNKSQAMIRSAIKDKSSPVPATLSQPMGAAHAPNRAKMMLPNLTLPKFHADISKDDHTCQTFIDTLEYMIKAYNLNDMEYYGMLEQQTEGRAKAMIKSLTLKNRSYATAKKILLKSFAEETPQKFAVIKKLNSLKMKPDGDPYIFFSEFTKVVEMAKEQSIDFSTYMQWCIWEAVPPTMQDTLISVTQKNWPNLDEIEENFLTASSRYEAHKPKKVAKESVSSHATHSQQNDPNVSSLATHVKNNTGTIPKKTASSPTKNSKFFCSFCKVNGHKSVHCFKYNSVEKKRDRMGVLNLCFGCLRSGHRIADCKSKQTLKCNKCDGNHYSFICNKTKMTPSSKTQSSNPVASQLVSCGTPVPTPITVVPNTSSQ